MLHYFIEILIIYISYDIMNKIKLFNLLNNLSRGEFKMMGYLLSFLIISVFAIIWIIIESSNRIKREEDERKEHQEQILAKEKERREQIEKNLQKKEQKRSELAEYYKTNLVTTEYFIRERIKYLWGKYPEDTYKILINFYKLYNIREYEKYIHDRISLKSFYKYFIFNCNNFIKCSTFSDFNDQKKWSYNELYDVIKLFLGDDALGSLSRPYSNRKLDNMHTEEISYTYLSRYIYNEFSNEVKREGNSSYLTAYDTRTLREIRYNLSTHKNKEFSITPNCFIYTEMILLTQALLQSVIADRYVEYIRKDEKFEHLIRQHVAKHSSNGDLKEIYDMYVEFYEHVFPEKIEYYDFCLVVHMYKQSLKAVTINQLKETCESDGIHYQNLVNAFRDSNETNIFMFISKSIPIYWSDIAPKDVNPQYIFSLLIPILLYETLDMVSFQSWFTAFFSINLFKEKYLLYYKHNNLLKDDSSLKENLLSKYTQVKTGEEFEAFLREVYLQLGYSVQMTPATGDQGADLIIEKHGVKSAVQAKHYSSPVGNKAVQEIVAALNYYKVSKGIVVTNNEFTKSAIELAKANNIELIDGKALTKMIESIKL